MEQTKFSKKLPLINKLLKSRKVITNIHFGITHSSIERKVFTIERKKRFLMSKILHFLVTKTGSSKEAITFLKRNHNKTIQIKILKISI